MAQLALSDEQLHQALDLAVRAAQSAASLINRAIDERSGASCEAREKTNSTDLVTEYDLQCEAEVLNILRAGTPLYAIVSEETQSEEKLQDEPTWIVDPIDGTTSFVHGLYDCCVSIALVVGKEPVLGVVCAPRLHEVFTAVKGRGAFSNGQRIHVSSTRSLTESLVLLHHGVKREKAVVKSEIEMMTELVQLPVHGVRCHGSAALDMCFVAAGRAELYIEVGVHAWDIAAGTIIVREAGGIVHDVDNVDTLDLTRRGFCCGCAAELTKYGVDLCRKYGYREAALGPTS